jgi:hypothetical protein
MTKTAVVPAGLSGWWWLRSPNNNNSNNARNINNNGNADNNNNVNNTNNGVVPDLFLICTFWAKKQPALCGKYHATVLETKASTAFPMASALGRT